MKFNAATAALFIATANAAYETHFLEQNTLCGDSKDCASRCRGGRYHVVTDENKSVYFGCSQKANNEFYQSYDNPSCNLGSGNGKAETDQSRAICNSVGGKLCPQDFRNGKTVNYCIIIHEDADKFAAACKASKGTLKTHNVDLHYEILARECK